MADYDEHDPILADLSGLSPLEIATRRHDENTAEDFLHDMYDAIAPALATQFRGLVEQGEREYRVLERVARWVEQADAESPVDPGDPSGFDAAAEAKVQRMVWQQVARSSSLALFDGLVAEGSRARWRWEDWAAATLSTLDYKAFKFKTSLGASDAKQAVNVAAHAIVKWDRLQQHTWLRYRNRYVTLRARAASGTISGMISTSRPIAVLPTDVQPAQIREQKGKTVVDISQVKEVGVFSFGSGVEIDKAGRTIVITPHAPGDLDLSAASLALGMGQKTRVVETSSGVLIRADASGTISFSAPKNVVSVHDDGVLLSSEK